MSKLQLNERHFEILRQLDANERRLPGYPENRDKCRAIFETDNIRELKELVKAGFVIRERNLASTNRSRRKYHIPNSMKMSHYAYGLTVAGRLYYWGVVVQVKEYETQ